MREMSKQEPRSSLHSNQMFIMVGGTHPTTVSEMQVRHRGSAELVDSDDEEVVILAFINRNLMLDAQGGENRRHGVGVPHHQRRIQILL